MITPAPVTELRTAVRFPLHLPVCVRSADRERIGETADISAAGALLAVDLDLEPGAEIEFTLVMPAEMVGQATPLQVRCTGRVVRTTCAGGRRCAAAIIDEYQFENGG